MEAVDAKRGEKEEKKKTKKKKKIRNDDPTSITIHTMYFFECKNASAISKKTAKLANMFYRFRPRRFRVCLESRNSCVSNP